MKARAIHHVAPRKVAIGHASLPALGPDQLLLRTLCSAISSGTESLIHEGRFPAGMARDSRIAGLQGGFEYPFTYGYALVGEVLDVGTHVDRSWLQRRVFAFHPHQDYTVVAQRDVLAIPDGVEPLAALFLPNMESAVNFVLDANPLLGAKAMVFGQGVVGLLTTALLARFPLALQASADPIEARRHRSLAFGAQRAIDPGDASQFAALREALFDDGDTGGLDVAIELSGNAHALNQAIELTGFDGTIVVGSWYGTGAQPIELGGHFHRRRIRLVSSQVSSVAPRLSGRWSRQRRIDLAWDAIARLEPQRLVTHRFRFDDCERAFALVSEPGDGALQVIFDYR